MMLDILDIHPSITNKTKSEVYFLCKEIYLFTEESSTQYLIYQNRPFSEKGQINIDCDVYNAWRRNNTNLACIVLTYCYFDFAAGDNRTTVSE